VEGTFHTKEVPVKPDPIVLTVSNACGLPFFRVRVTSPVALVQLIVNGWPAVTSLKVTSVKDTAFATATSAAAAMKFENCIFGLL
jgi:hypothetical protein